MERMLFEAQLAAEQIGSSILPEMIFMDKISGRKSDRPDFSSIWKLIESREVDVVIFYRVDRLGRDIEVLVKLGKLFEKTGVKAYVCEKNKFLDWKDVNDWEYWQQASLASEKESRILASRLTKVHKFNQHKRQASFVCPFGYTRNPETRKYEPELSEWDFAVRMVEIIEQEKGNGAKAVKRIYEELGQKWTRMGLRNWMRNPVLGGHTFYERSGQTIYNTHSGWVDGEYHPEKDFRLLTDERSRTIESMFKERSFYRGTNTNKIPYSLTGLLSCVCGATCAVMKCNRKNGRVYLYIRCRANEERWRHIPRHTGTMLVYEQVEKTVIEHLASCAQIIADTVLEKEDVPPNPEVLKKIAHVEYLQTGINQFGDPTGEQIRTIAKLKAEIAEISKSKGNSQESQEIRKRLSGMANVTTWYKATKEELRGYFVAFIEEILIDFEAGNIAVTLNPLLRL